MKSLSSLFKRPSPEPGIINVRDLIARLSDAELLQAADAYFSGLTLDSEQCHKPFSNPSDAIQITRHLSLLLQAAELFRTADVLDFGCATGWLTIAMAGMGCYTVGVDIAPSAVALAEALLAQRGTRGGGTARFLAYDGQRLPVDDESVDRVICFDSFHHVKDQALVLAEFARVLRPGGRVAMVEPGPYHSLTAQSQMEMTRYKVIENDVVMADVAAAAKRVGLSEPQMLVHLQKPLTVSLDVFDRWSGTAGLSPEDAEQLLSLMKAGLTDTQCFFMTKGEAAPDSRRPEFLAADLQLLSARSADASGSAFELHFRIRNTGEAVWLAEKGKPGAVNLGCQLLGPDGSLEDLNYQRFSLGAQRVHPGEEINLVVSVPTPSLAKCCLRFDLVSEFVAWFSQLPRSKAVEWRLDP